MRRNRAIARDFHPASRNASSRVVATQLASGASRAACYGDTGAAGPGRIDPIPFGPTQLSYSQRMIEFGHSTHVGLRREHNEDTYYADAALGLWLVADGMGGHEHGEVASALARDTLVREVGKGATLTAAIQLADEEIIRHSTRRSEALPMGTTIAALRIGDREYEVAWVGDSRVYIWNGGLRQLSQDHSYVQELIDQGAITSEQARSHPHRNVVTQALGVTDPQSMRIGSARGALTPGMQLLLCSDGLTEEVTDAAIGAVLGREELSAQECVDHLVLAALDQGGADNVTVILVRSR